MDPVQHWEHVMELVERRMGSMSCASVERERESPSTGREKEKRCGWWVVLLGEDKVMIFRVGLIELHYKWIYLISQRSLSSYFFYFTSLVKK
jgi:hypothetical protein